MLVGYIRVFTAEQKLALQRDALLTTGVELKQIYEDTCSGTVAGRPGLASVLDVLRAGDALVVWKLVLGRYAFTLPEPVARGELRPLRDPATADDDD